MNEAPLYMSPPPPLYFSTLYFSYLAVLGLSCDIQDVALWLMGSVVVQMAQ